MKNKKLDNVNDQQIHQALVTAYNALDEKGYNALSQLVGYLFTDDPTYITPYNNARKTLEAIDREELMMHILRYYFED